MAALARDETQGNLSDSFFRMPEASQARRGRWMKSRNGTDLSPSCTSH